MKLIDMLVDAGLNGWKWPDGTIAITQDKDKAINQYATADGLETNEHGTWKYSASWQTYLRLSHEELCLASDWATAIITREQYEAALAAKNDGWIEWGGGKCPVEEGTLVDVRYRDSQAYPDRIGALALVEGGSGATYHHWLHDGMMNDIIAYRLHQPQESDLNERIGQCITPVWNGADLPPVGCFCEITDPDGMLVYGQGESGEVIAHVENTAVIRMSYGLGCFEARFLRPIRTEAERKRDAAVEIMTQILCSQSQASATAKKIYNAIAAGKIPGVKLED